MEVRERQGELLALGAGVVVAGFSPPAAMAQLARHLELPWPVLSDQERVLYQRLAIRRAPLLDVYSQGTLAMYLRALRRRQRLHPPVEDTRQLGADAIVVRGRAVRVFRPRTPDDRPSVDAILAVIRQLQAPPD